MGAEGGLRTWTPILLRTFVKYLDPVSTPTLKLLHYQGSNRLKGQRWPHRALRIHPCPPAAPLWLGMRRTCPSRLIPNLLFFFFFLWSRPSRLVQVWKALWQPLFVLGVRRLLTGCVTFFGKKGRQANTPSIETPYLLYLQLNTRLYGNL